MKVARYIALLAFLLGVGRPAGAMVVVQREFPELVALAEQIVVGTVTDIKQAADTSGAPATYVTFSDLTVLKGDVGDTLTLRFYGGESGGVVVHIADMPAFTLGERAVLFVAGNGQAVCPLVGVWQGRFHVRFDADQQTDVVETDDRTPVVGLAGRRILRAPATAEGPTAAAMPLGDFLESIAGELAQPAAAGTPAR
ncbi:MAG TPA: hypothetical protein VMW56_21285 [Candidatus Margulisiibacteriota bacterium]|nr:hypothetical protein [Candidatus Margulisiibacteriota bacterium]